MALGFAQTDARSLLIRVDQHDIRSLESGPDYRRAAAVKLVQAVLEPAHRAAADPRPLRKLLLRPVEQPPCGAALFWRQHAFNLEPALIKINIDHIGEIRQRSHARTETFAPPPRGAAHPEKSCRTRRRSSPPL
jgi:hypothetical protein